jgi:hypothetical protein
MARIERRLVPPAVSASPNVISTTLRLMPNPKIFAAFMVARRQNE